MSFINENILKAERDDIEKLDAFLNCEESSDDSDTSSDEDVGIPSTNEANKEVIENIEFNDVTPYDQQIQAIFSNISTFNLNTVLFLNTVQQKLLIEGIRKFQKLLQNCDEQLNRIKIMKNELTTKKKDKFSSWYRCGVPFFKDILFRHYCPSNADVHKKRRNGELALIDLPTCKFWLPHEKEILKNEVYTQSKQIRIRTIRNKSQNQDIIDEWKNKPAKECVFPISDQNVFIDWLNISIHSLNDRHTDEACKAMWYQYLHPHLNNKAYGPREAARLNEIATKYNFQNWDKIAEELGTNRSGYHCCLFNRMNQQKNNKKALKWTSDEDAQLMSLIEKYKIGNFIPWGRIAHIFPNRDKTQIYNRYHTSLRAELKKGKFTKQEDLMLLSLAKKFGDNIKEICKYFPGRNGSQIRIRYTSLILNDNKSTPWTEEEDKRIIEFVKENYKPGQSISWKQLETVLDLPHRNRTNIRHRWNTIKNYLNSSFDGDLSVIPRPHKYRRSRQIKQTNVDNVLMILNDTNSKMCDLNLTNITEQVLSEETKKDIIEQFQLFFITKFSKILIDHPITITQTDILNTLFLINVLHGCVHTDLLYNKKFKNCYTEKNEIKIVGVLRDIVQRMNDHPHEILFNFLNSTYSLQLCTEQTTIHSIIPKCFTTIDEFDHMIAVIKPLLKYTIWKDSKLDTFYVKTTGRFERNLKLNLLKDQQLLQEYERIIIESSTSITCKAFLDGSNARESKSARCTEIFKTRFMAVYNFKSMESQVKEILHKSVQMKTEYMPGRKKKPPKVLKKGRPRKMLPGGRYKYKQKENDGSKDEARNKSSTSGENQLTNKESDSTLESIKEECVSENSQNGLESDDEPIVKKIKLI